MAGLFPLFFGILPFVFGRKGHAWPFIVGAFFLVTAVALPKTLVPVEKLWLKVGAIMGWINARVILSLVYFIIFVPAALIRKIAGYDPLERKFDSKRSSYRSVRPADFKDIKMEHPF